MGRSNESKMRRKSKRFLNRKLTKVNRKIKKEVKTFLSGKSVPEISKKRRSKSRPQDGKAPLTKTKQMIVLGLLSGMEDARRSLQRSVLYRFMGDENKMRLSEALSISGLKRKAMKLAGSRREVEAFLRFAGNDKVVVKFVPYSYLVEKSWRVNSFFYRSEFMMNRILCLPSMKLLAFKAGKIATLMGKPKMAKRLSLLSSLSKARLSFKSSLKAFRVFLRLICIIIEGVKFTWSSLVGLCGGTVC
jgi:hypothetical protein